MKTIEEALFNYQLEKRITQHEMANMLNVSQATYNNWINQKFLISPKYYPVIAKKCGIDVSSFTSNQESIPLTENKTSENELKVYQKFAQSLEEQIALLKERANELQSKLLDREVLIKSQQEELNKLRKQKL